MVKWSSKFTTYETCEDFFLLTDFLWHCNIQIQNKMLKVTPVLHQKSTFFNMFKAAWFMSEQGTWWSLDKKLDPFWFLGNLPVIDAFTCAKDKILTLLIKYYALIVKLQIPFAKHQSCDHPIPRN